MASTTSSFQQDYQAAEAETIPILKHQWDLLIGFYIISTTIELRVHHSSPVIFLPLLIVRVPSILP